MESLGCLSPFAALQPDALHRLALPSASATDAARTDLRGLAGLGQLDLAESLITDAELAHLGALAGPELLDLAYTATTGARRMHLRGLIRMEWPYLGGNNIHPVG